MRRPKVSIGLPVYNGENFLSIAIDSILNQTFEDFELIISDNASTDGTEAICREYASKDKRILYSRNSENIGASRNYTKAFGLSKGEYFKWAAHDDVCLPNFLSRCISVLDSDSSIVLCHTKTASIDERGQEVIEWDILQGMDSSDLQARFKKALQISKATYLVWAVMRRSVLSKTKLLGNYTWHDRPLLSCLSLFGKFYQVPEVLFQLREHGSRSIRVYDWRRPREAVAWYDPKKAGKLTFPTWRLLYEHIAGINRAPIRLVDRIRCYGSLLEWTSDYTRQLKHDLIIALEYVPGIKAEWLNPLDKTASDIKALVPIGDTFIFVDEETLETEIFGDRYTVPFLEKDGLYWGNPPSDEVAIQELERLVCEGANYIIFAWPSFWWFDHYKDFLDYLSNNYECLIMNERIRAFELRTRM